MEINVKGVGPFWKLGVQFNAKAMDSFSPSMNFFIEVSFGNWGYNFGGLRVGKKSRIGFARRLAFPLGSAFTPSPLPPHSHPMEAS